MLQKIFFSLLLTVVLQTAFSQAVGNWMYNQKKSYKSSDKIYAWENEINIPIQQNTYQGLYQENYFSDTTIVISSKVIMNVKADGYIAIFGVSQLDETIESCQKLIDERINNFKTALKTIGINDNQIYVDFISQIPIFEVEVEKKLFSKTYNEVPAGFEVKKNIHIKFKDNTIVEKLLTLAAKNEIYDIIKVDYIINDMSAVYDTIRSAGIKNLQKKIKSYEGLGIDFTSEYKTFDEKFHSIYPIERYSSFQAFSSLSGTRVAAGKKVIRRPEQITVYYDKYPFNSFDVVINPDVFEPTVQFVSTLKMKFVLKKQ